MFIIPNSIKPLPSGGQHADQVRLQDSLPRFHSLSGSEAERFLPSFTCKVNRGVAL